MKNEILKTIKEALEIEELDVNLDAELMSLEQWDSVGVLSLMAFLDERFKITLDMKRIKAETRIIDLIEIILECE